MTFAQFGASDSPSDIRVIRAIRGWLFFSVIRVHSCPFVVRSYFSSQSFWKAGSQSKASS